VNATNETALALIPPAELVKRSRDAIAAVRDVVEKHYIDVIDGKRYLKVAGAQAMATSLGYTTGTSTCRYIARGDDGVPGRWEAVATVMLQGVVVATGISAVFDDERGWSRKPHFARMGMASTRATGRALKGVMGWATALVGAEGSLSEEMPDNGPTTAQDASEAPRRLPAPSKAPTQEKATRTVSGVCAAVSEHVAKSGKSYWRVALEDGSEFTSFRPLSNDELQGKTVELILRDGPKGPVCEDAYDITEVL
jgi:hypothetical protein